MRILDPGHECEIDIFRLTKKRLFQIVVQKKVISMEWKFQTRKSNPRRASYQVHLSICITAVE